MKMKKFLPKPVRYTSPLEIPYLSKIIFSLSTIGAWPSDLGQKRWFSDFRNSQFLSGLSIFLCALCMLYLRKNFNTLSFLDLGRCVINCFLWSFMIQRIFSTKTQRFKETSIQFLNRMHLFYYKDKNEYSMKIYKDVDKIATYFTNVLHFELYWGIFLFILTPLYNSYDRGMFKAVKPVNATYDQSVFYEVPFNYVTDFRGFLFIFIINCFITFDVATCFVALDLYILVIVFHLWGHLKILQHNLRQIPRPKMEGIQMDSIMNPPWYDEEESKEIKALLIDSLGYYKIIKESSRVPGYIIGNTTEKFVQWFLCEKITNKCTNAFNITSIVINQFYLTKSEWKFLAYYRFMAEVSLTFGATICVYYLLHQIIGCILLLEFIQMNPEALGAYGMLTITAFQQLIQMSIIFELIDSQSETIKDAVYDVPWECMDTKNRKIVLMYLCNVQEPMKLKALGILPVGVKTMASIIKTSLSYFMLLRTSVER